MGTAKIVENLGHCMYSVEVVKNTARIEEAKRRCADGISRAESDMATAEQDEANARAAILSAGEALEAAIIAANGNAMDKAVLAAQDKQTAAAQALERAQSAKAVAKLQKLSIEKELATYDTVQTTESRNIWCADATEDLQSGETVGTVEINQEPTQMLIRPAGAAPDSILEPGLANTAAATYLNWAALPGVQRWKPTYRVGTIKEVDYDADTCMVCLDDARSSAQNLKINPEGLECETQKDGPQGFVEFCAREPGHPACQANGSSVLTYNAALQAKLDAINAQINRDNTYAYDESQFGRLEFWEEMPQSGGAGDCEDFALAKYRACLNAGIPASALRLATGQTTAGIGHAWLEVQTDRGNYALDLNTTKAAPSSSLPYSGRAVQADGINWSGKGLLIEDVPVVYMGCNAAAFKVGDRVVVHFKDSDWKKPEVIGFEENPTSCGLYAIYKSGVTYKAASLAIGGTQIKAKNNDTLLVSKLIGVNGTVPHFYKRAKMKVSVTEGSVTTIQDREIAFVGLPFFYNGESYNYQGEPCVFPPDSNARFYVYAVDLKTKTMVMVFFDYKQIGVCNMPHLTPNNGSGSTNVHMSSWNHSDTHVFFARESLESMRPIKCSAQSFKIVNGRLGVDAIIERLATFENIYEYGFSINANGDLIYFESESNYADTKVRSLNIVSGSKTVIKEYVNSNEIYPHNWPKCFYQTMSDPIKGFGVGHVFMVDNYIEHFEFDNTLKTSDGLTIIENVEKPILCGGPVDYAAEAAAFLTFKQNTKPFFTFFKRNGWDGVKYSNDIFVSTPDGPKLIYTAYAGEGSNQAEYRLKLNRFQNSGYLFPMSNIVVERFNIQHAACIGYENGVAYVKENYIYIDEVNKTSQVATAIGCAPGDIVGIVFVQGL